MYACTTDKAVEADAHSHEDVKLQLVSYNDDFEVYAEADPFVLNKESSILAHFSLLKDFKPLTEGSITMSLIAGNKGVRQTIEEPLRDGIYSFTINPVTSGDARLIFEISMGDSANRIVIRDLYVYEHEHDAIHTAEEALIADPNGIIFTKEQSWQVEFSTCEVKKAAFGRVIKTGALVQPAQKDKVNIVARTGGIVDFSGDNFFNGTAVEAGEALFSISGAGLSEENSYVRYVEAKNNYEETKTNYERSRVLAEDKIIPESEFLKAKREFEVARVVYESLKENFIEGKQLVTSPISGFIHQIYVENGEFVEPGQSLMDVARNERLVLMADVQQKYSGELPNIVSANIKRIQDGETYTLEELNGSLSAYGKSVNPDNYLIPLRFEINNTIGLVPGSFVELYILTESKEQALLIPDDAVLEEQGKHFVLLQLTPELFTKREVHIGISDGLQTEVIKGLEEGERIVSAGAILVKLSQASGALDPHAGHVH